MFKGTNNIGKDADGNVRFRCSETKVFVFHHPQSQFIETAEAHSGTAKALCLGDCNGRVRESGGRPTVFATPLVREKGATDRDRYSMDSSVRVNE